MVYAKNLTTRVCILGLDARKFSATKMSKLTVLRDYVHCGLGSFIGSMYRIIFSEV